MQRAGEDLRLVEPDVGGLRDALHSRLPPLRVGLARWRLVEDRLAGLDLLGDGLLHRADPALALIGPRPVDVAVEDGELLDLLGEHGEVLPELEERLRRDIAGDDVAPEDDVRLDLSRGLLDRGVVGDQVLEQLEGLRDLHLGHDPRLDDDGLVAGLDLAGIVHRWAEAVVLARELAAVGELRDEGIDRPLELVPHGQAAAEADQYVEERALVSGRWGLRVLCHLPSPLLPLVWAVLHYAKISSLFFS